MDVSPLQGFTLLSAVTKGGALGYRIVPLWGSIISVIQGSSPASTHAGYDPCTARFQPVNQAWALALNDTVLCPTDQRASHEIAQANGLGYSEHAREALKARHKPRRTGPHWPSPALRAAGVAELRSQRHNLSKLLAQR